jgi:hypothetical protein
MHTIKHWVEWSIYLSSQHGESPIEHTAGPFVHRPTAERFAAGLAESIGPRLGGVTIRTEETETETEEG